MANSQPEKSDTRRGGVASEPDEKTFRKAIARWWQGVATWWQFMGARRRDLRFRVFPEPLKAAEWLAIGASVSVFLIFTADRAYLDQLNRDPIVPVDFFWAITDLTKSNWILVTTAAVLIAASILTSERFRGAGRRVWHRVTLSFWYIFFTVAGSGLLTSLLKTIFGRARPELTPEGMVWLSSHLTDTYDYASFPSGHSTTAGALAMALALLFPRLRIFLLLAGAWLAFARPAIGVHFPSDAVAGYAIGVVFSYFSARYLASFRLLFHFTDDGGIDVRGERRRAMGAFARQLIRGADRQAKTDEPSPDRASKP